MSAIHLHLLLNHAPLFGDLFGAALLLAAAPRRNRTLFKTALVVLVLSAAVTPLVFITGGRAADSIGRIEGVAQEAIEPHETAAKQFLVISSINGVIALIGLLRPRRGVTIAVAVFSVVTLLLAARTANLGGLIRHTEITSARTSTS